MFCPAKAPSNKTVMKISQKDLEAFVPILSQPGHKNLLHVGCGMSRPERLPECFRNENWREIRLDIDPKVKPHIVASITDMTQVPTRSVDAVWSSHNLEHLEDFQVPVALAEIQRVLKPGGFALITLPDLACVTGLITQGKGDDVLYNSPAGPITPIDMLFGHRASMARGNTFMAHRTGFTAERLGQKLTEAGFAEVRVTHGKSYDLWAVAVTGTTI